MQAAITCQPLSGCSSDSFFGGLLCAEDRRGVRWRYKSPEESVLSSADLCDDGVPMAIPMGESQPHMGLYKDSCKSGHKTQTELHRSIKPRPVEVLHLVIRAVFGRIILPVARLIRAV